MTDLRILLMWTSLGLAMNTSPVHAAVNRLDVPIENTVPDQGLGKLMELFESMCGENPNLTACNLVDPSQLRESLGASDTRSVVESLFTLYISYLSQQHKELILQKDLLEKQNEELQNRGKSLEALCLPHVIGNKTEESQSTLANLFSTPSMGPNMNIYSPSAMFLRPADCADHLLLGATKSGVYEIFPFRCRCSQPVKVWCDMETEGGGWTVFLKRENMTTREDFNRSWTEYQEGFGDASREFYMGNEHLHALTANRQYTLRLDLKLSDGSEKFSEWNTFAILDSRNKFKLSIGAFQSHSMTTDCFTQINGMFFSTSDYDNERSGANCALNHRCGWWHNNCALFTPCSAPSDGLISTLCPYVTNGKKVNMVASKVELKIRPNICGRTVESVYFNSHTCTRYNLGK